MNKDKDTEYKTILEPTQASFTEKKSEFIASICPVTTETEAVAFINEVKSKNRKATHNCYAYILRENNIIRYSDDGEPSGTAGIPIYETIRKKGLTDTGIVVTRYFGGILLGAGGLVRAYTCAASLAISCAKIKCPALADKLVLRVGYSLYGRIGSVLEDYDVRVIKEDFSDIVCIELFIRTGLSESFIKELQDTCSGKIIVEIIQKEMYDFS